jgi:parallel beta-helix repeat protein
MARNALRTSWRRTGGKILKYPKTRIRLSPTTPALLAMIAFAVGGFMVLDADRALASHVSCGDTITTDTTLDSDLVDCPNNGIVIGADDITLDLNGHLVQGDSTMFAGCPNKEFCDIGLLNDGHDGVTVRHGSVREFAIGVFVERARRNRVLGISSSRNPLFGIVVERSARSLVRNSSASGNLGPDADGMGVFGTHHVRILRNSIRRNGQLGIHVADSTRVLIKGNVISRNPSAVALEADRNQVRHNRVARNGNGIGVAGSRNVIRRNRVDDSRGAAPPGGFGIALEQGDNNLIAANAIRDTQASAISVGFEPGAGNVVRRNRILRSGKAGLLVDSKGKHTLLIRNVIRGAGEDGVLVKSTAKRTVLRRNHSFGAKDDGIDIDSSTTKLTRNEARRNADLGIEAVPSVTDTGGNRASGNGNPLQCTNVFCSSR